MSFNGHHQMLLQRVWSLQVNKFEQVFSIGNHMSERWEGVRSHAGGRGTGRSQGKVVHKTYHMMHLMLYTKHRIVFPELSFTSFLQHETQFPLRHFQENIKSNKI